MGWTFHPQGLNILPLYAHATHVKSLKTFNPFYKMQADCLGLRSRAYYFREENNNVWKEELNALQNLDALVSLDEFVPVFSSSTGL